MLTHQTILKVTEDYENFKFNTMIAALMGFSNTLAEAKETAVYGTAAWDEAVAALLLLMAPAMPHISEELWPRLGKPYSIHTQAWPLGDPELAKAESVEIAIQINGKMRDRIGLPPTPTRRTSGRGPGQPRRAEVDRWRDRAQGDRRAGTDGQYRGELNADDIRCDAATGGCSEVRSA